MIDLCELDLCEPDLCKVELWELDFCKRGVWKVERCEVFLWGTALGEVVRGEVVRGAMNRDELDRCGETFCVVDFLKSEPAELEFRVEVDGVGTNLLR